jgi:hypothetical protein
VNKSEILPKVLEVLYNLRQQDGWTDLARIGKPLNDLGINYKALGYLKLKEFLEEFNESIDFKADSSYATPVIYARQALAKNTQLSIEPKPLNSNPNFSRIGNKQIPPRILFWAYIDDFRQTINDLKDLALKERWYYKTQDPAYPFPILAKYLNYTFYRLTKEKNKILCTERYAAFNTGLVNKLYEPIYALLEKNRHSGQEWYFHEFCVSGVGKAGKILASNFNPLPQRAHYFKDPSELIYENNAPKPQLNWDHIILDNISRFPFELLEEYKPENFIFRDITTMSTIEKEEYYRKLAVAVENDSKKFRSIKNRLSDSLETALKRIEWNFKTAIPMYYPRTNKMSLLLPLSLIDDDVIDLALVTERTQSGNYLGHTVLPLDWAYSNARLVTRPDSDWLVAEQIETALMADSDETDVE